MANPLILRVVLLVCIFLGGLFAIIATAGKEWLKRDGYDRRTYTAGLWDYCYKVMDYYDSYTLCSPVNWALRRMKSSLKEKLDAARAFMIIGILQYGAAFLLLALAQFLKKDIFQKIVALTFWSIFICGIIAMSCIISLVKELYDYVAKDHAFSFSYSWCFGIAWASVAVALIGSIISTIGLFKSPRETNAPVPNASIMSFKK